MKKEKTKPTTCTGYDAGIYTPVKLSDVLAKQQRRVELAGIGVAIAHAAASSCNVAYTRIKGAELNHHGGISWGKAMEAQGVYERMRIVLKRDVDHNSKVGIAGDKWYADRLKEVVKLTRLAMWEAREAIIQTA